MWFEGSALGFPGPLLRVDFGFETDFVSIEINNQDGFDFRRTDPARR